MACPNPQRCSSANICWICHQEAINNETKVNTSKHPIGEHRSYSSSFRPCLCKGSLSIIHKECLNEWASEQYKLATKDNIKEDLPAIRCPNCKAPYQYSVMEIKKFRGIKVAKLVSTESFWLLFLILAQIVVMVYDIFVLSDKECEKILDLKSEGAKEMKMSQYLHVSTALVVIFAAAYTLLEALQSETKVEIHSQC